MAEKGNRVCRSCGNPDCSVRGHLRERLCVGCWGMAVQQAARVLRGWPGNREQITDPSWRLGKPWKPA